MRTGLIGTLLTPATSRQMLFLRLTYWAVEFGVQEMGVGSSDRRRE
jgi:hypothetical protein